jgi:hypothetical protein
MTVPQKTAPAGDVMESVIIKGDLSQLTPAERVTYYNAVCKSLGLNALTQPFRYIMLNGKLTLYPGRDCADQLRKINSISLELVSEQQRDDLLTVHARASTPDGRKDEDLGVVFLPSTMRGEVRANTILKAVTKAKRRVTLSISGLGLMDETEIEDIPAEAKGPAPPAPNVLLHDPRTGEIKTTAGKTDRSPDAVDADPALSNPPPPGVGPPESGAAHEMTMDEADAFLADAAKAGMEKLSVAWEKLPLAQRKTLKVALERRHKPTAIQADEAKGDGR